MVKKIKVYELARELSLEPQHVIEVSRRLGLDIKNAMSFLGSEEARNVRDFYRRNGPKAKTTVTVKKGPMTEKRVGATVIRRRKAKTPPPEEPKEEAPVEAPEAPVEAAPEAPAEETKTARPSKRHNDPIVKRSVTSDEPTQEGLKVIKEAETEEAAPEAPAAKQEEAPKPRRRMISPIIKRVGTEKHLGDTIGPKLERKPRPKPAPGTSTTSTTTGTDATGVRGRVREIELKQPEQKDAKRRVVQRQNSVFRTSDFLRRERVAQQRKKKSGMSRPAMKTKITMAAEHKRVVEMGETISVADFAKGVAQKVKKVRMKLKEMGVEVDDQGTIDHDTAVLLAGEFKYTVKQVVFKEEDFLPTTEENEKNLKTRAPVVTIMGHVDHGKTSILDKIRKSKVAEGEAGGITQHVGAYTVDLKKGRITFLDTPGHQAFTEMRSRGAKVTDIVVLVVSATDGVMPQTLESINHAKAAGVPLIVAVNKCDLPEANPDKTKQTLAGHDLTPEEWGGDTLYVNVSAKTGDGLDQLLESILLQAELLELKADPTIPGVGTIIESRLDKGRGVVATMLVQKGKIKRGDVVVVGSTFGKVRAVNDFMGKQMKVAQPSDAVELLGLSDIPTVGDPIYVVDDERSARDLVSKRVEIEKAEKAASRGPVTLDEIFAASKETKELLVVLKADVTGSVEAVKGALNEFPQDKVKIKVLHAATGAITESDVYLAVSSGGLVVGFNIRPDGKAKRLAEKEGIEVLTYRVIYELIDDIKAKLEGLLDKKIQEKVIGRAEVRETFSVPKIGLIAGSAVIDGKVTRGCFIRLLRDSQIVYEGKISSLRRFKDDAKEVAQGFECGIGLENFNDVKQGDQLEAYIKEEISETL